MTDRVLSMRTSLDASTVTPGNTAPEASLTTPAMVLCARAAVGSTKIPSATKIAAAIPLLAMPLPPNGQLLDPDEERGADEERRKIDQTSSAAGLAESRIFHGTRFQIVAVRIPPAAYLDGQRPRRGEAERRVGDFHRPIEPAWRRESQRKGVM